jgi:hypothetical protein
MAETSLDVVRGSGVKPAIEFRDQRVIIRLPKMVLVLRRETFLEALRQGKAFLRAESFAERPDA